MIKPIGKGAFGRVYLAKDVKNEKVVALKVLKKNRLIENQ
jgi:serine/threonine protein kinase